MVGVKIGMLVEDEIDGHSHRMHTYVRRRRRTNRYWSHESSLVPRFGEAAPPSEIFRNITSSFVPLNSAWNWYHEPDRHYFFLLSFPRETDREETKASKHDIEPNACAPSLALPQLGTRRKMREASTWAPGARRSGGGNSRGSTAVP